MGLRGSRKGYGNPKIISFLSFFFLFVWNLAVHDNQTSWPFVPDNSNLFTIWPLIPQPIYRTATARLAVDTTFTMETFINLT